MDILRTISSPADLRAVPAADLPQLAGEIRAFLVDSLSRTGGHLGPNLGVVELTIALHRVFEVPILFDTGHQTYVHKMLTGRLDQFDTLRTRGGMSGYPSRAESDYDWIENSHASVALSHADGLARNLGRVVTVVGDGSLTGGMAWEALSSIASDQVPVIIVVNDNGRSYAPTVGNPLAVLEAAGIPVHGPVYGHDCGEIEKSLKNASLHDAPLALHIRTHKGHGYPHVLNDELHHSTGAYDPATGIGRTGGETWTDVFSQELLSHFSHRDDLVAITAAMPGPTGLAPIAASYPDRFRDVGIAEQHAVASAAGMARAGQHPVVAIYSTFFHRAFDQLLLDVSLHQLPTTFILDRAGVTGSDGPSHNGLWDMALCSTVPGLKLAAPRDARTLRLALEQALDVDDGPTVIRFPKGEAPQRDGRPESRELDAPGVLDLLAGNPAPNDVLIVGIGAMADIAVEVHDLLTDVGIPSSVVSPLWAAPVPAVLIDVASHARHIVTIEDGVVRGGIGSLIAESLDDAGHDLPVQRFGVPTVFPSHGSRAEILAYCGLAPGTIAEKVVLRLCRPAH